MRTSVIAGLFALLMVAYLPLWSNGFVYEDWNLFSHAGPKWGALAGLKPTGELTMASWDLQRGNKPFPDPRLAHGINLALHVVVGLLAGFLALRLEWPLPWLVTGVIWLHPLNVEAVAYGSGRGELLVAVGLLMSALAVTVQGWRRRIGLLAGAWLAMHAKPNGIVVFGIVPLVWWYQTREQRAWRTQWFPSWAVTVFAVAVLIELPLVLLFANAWNVENGVGMTWWRWVSSESTAFLRLIGMVVVPLGQNIDFDYASVPQWWQTTCVGIVVWMVAMVWACRKRLPEATFIFGWLLIVIAPRFFVKVPLSVLNEHHWYPAMVGMAFWCPACIDRWLTPKTLKSR